MTADGNWNLAISTPMGERRATQSVKTEGTSLNGSQSAEGRPLAFLTAVSTGANYPGKSPPLNPMDMTLEFTGAIEGDKISGTVKFGPFGSAQSSGTHS
jgi:hypothetical protein